MPPRGVVEFALENQALVGGVGPGGLDNDRRGQTERAHFIRLQNGAPETVVAGASAGDGVVEGLVHGAQPGLGPPDGSAVGGVVALLFVLEDEEGAVGARGALDGPEVLDGQGGFSVVVFVLDVQSGRGGVYDDEAGVVELGGFQHAGLPFVHQGHVEEVEVGGEEVNGRAAQAMPDPLVVFDEVGAGVFFVEVADGEGRGGEEIEEGEPRGHAVGQVVAEEGFAHTGFACEGDHGALGQHVLDKPGGCGVFVGEEVREGLTGHRGRVWDESWGSQGGTGMQMEGPGFQRGTPSERAFQAIAACAAAHFYEGLCAECADAFAAEAVRAEREAWEETVPEEWIEVGAARREELRARTTASGEEGKMLCSVCGEMVDPEGHRWECSPKAPRP